MPSSRRAAWLAVPAAAVAVAITSAGPASAHVTISPEEGRAGSYTVLTVSVPHGCEGSATTKVAVQMPEQVLSVTPTRHASWQVRKVMTELDDPVTDSEGNRVTERVDRVVYTADDPLPDGYRDAFELSLQLPDTRARPWSSPRSRPVNGARPPGPRSPGQGRTPSSWRRRRPR